MVILNIITVEEKNRWNEVVKSFENWDIYYLSDYAVSFQLHGDGIPVLIEYRDADSRFCYVVMKSDIADSAHFTGKLEPKRYFDYETPYGYGGPLYDTPILVRSQKKFLQEMTDYAKSQGIISQFVRFHPLLANHETASLIFETRYLRDTIYMDTTSPEGIMSNMDSKNRNMVRKAIKNGVVIEHRPIDEFQEFKLMYEETMLKDGADKYYTFQEDYFRSQEALKDNASIFYAVREGKPIAGSVIYHNNQFAHYHLAGTHTEYRKYAPSNLLLYEVACWACERGIKKFHLGGGMSLDDYLFGFKKQFNKFGRLPFIVGRTVFDPGIYEELLLLRKDNEIYFDMNNRRMIQYRA